MIVIVGECSRTPLTQAKSVLRMLTAMVTLGSDSAREVLARINWDSESWATLPKRSSLQDPPDVRTCFIHFLLSFLFDSSKEVVREFLERKQSLASIFPGLAKDPPATVLLVLGTLKTRLLENPLVSKTLRMKLFGAYNLKPLVALLERSEGEGVEEEQQEEAQEMKEAVSSFLCLLLGSHKQGVVWQDQEHGCGDKSPNPLAKEVLASLARPWERPNLLPVLLALLRSCPGLLPQLLDLLKEAGQPRDAPAWHQTHALLKSVLASPLPPPSNTYPSILQAITKTLLLPQKLLLLLAAGVRDSESAVVRGQCLSLLAQLASNLRTFRDSLPRSSKSVVTQAAKELLSPLPRVQQLLWRWQEVLEAGGESQTALHCLQLATFMLEHGTSHPGLKPGEVLALAEKHREQLGELAPAVQLEALRLCHSVTTGPKSDPALLAALCSPSTLELLLKSTLEEEGDRRSTSGRILSSLVKAAGLGLTSGEDTALLLALLSKERVDVAAICLAKALKEKEQLKEQILSLQLLRLPVGKEASVDHLLQTLMDPDFKQEQVKDYVLEQEEELISPLLLALLSCFKDAPNLVLELVSRMAGLLEDRDAFVKLVIEVEPSLRKELLAALESPLSLSPEQALALGPWVLLRAHTLQALHLQEQKHLTNLLLLAPEETRKRLLKMLLSRKSLILGFDPYNTATYDPMEPTEGQSTDLVLELIKIAKGVGVQAPALKEKFLKATQDVLAGTNLSTESGSSILSCFSLLPLQEQEVQDLLQVLLLRPATDFTSKFPITDLFSTQRRPTVLGHMITGCVAALATLPSSSLSSSSLLLLLQRSCPLLELLLDTQEASSLATSLQFLLLASPSLAEALAENLALVCARQGSKKHLELLGTLVISPRHLEAFKSWVLEEKGRMDRRFWTLVPKLFGQEEVHHEKKFVTIIVKNVVKEVEVVLKSGEPCEDQPMLQEVVQYLCQFTKSDKQLELWSKALGPRQEKQEAPASPALLLLRWSLLSTLHRSQGGQDGRMIKEVFLPILQTLISALKPPKEGGHDTSLIEQLCKAASECKASSENKTFAKELAKGQDTWELFLRSALRYSLRVGAGAGEAALLLLTEVATFLQSGGKLTNSSSICEMVQSHSLYLQTMLGPSCGLKTALVRLLLALGECALRVEQVGLMDRVMIIGSYYCACTPSS